MKAKIADEAKKLTDIPNVGKATVQDFELIGIKKPLDLKNKDGIKLYQKLNKISGVTHDPCTADVFLSAIDFMNGGDPKSWWKFTKTRKKLMKSSIKGER